MCLNNKLIYRKSEWQPWSFALPQLSFMKGSCLLLAPEHGWERQVALSFVCEQAQENGLPHAARKKCSSILRLSKSKDFRLWGTGWSLLQFLCSTENWGSRQRKHSSQSDAASKAGLLALQREVLLIACYCSCAWMTMVRREESVLKLFMCGPPEASFAGWRLWLFRISYNPEASRDVERVNLIGHRSCLYLNFLWTDPNTGL